MPGSALKPATELVRDSVAHFPNESDAYRRARQQLLVEEIELRRHIERVAELRRALPPGGAVTKDYAFEGEGGKAILSDLFGDKPTLVIYSYMFGPAREQPCPMCTSFMSTWEAKLPDVERRIAFVFVARSPIARLIEARRVAGCGTGSTPTPRATTRAITSVPPMPTRPARPMTSLAPCNRRRAARCASIRLRISFSLSRRWSRNISVRIPRPKWI